MIHYALIYTTQPRCMEVLQKPRNARTHKSRQKPYLQTISPECLNCLRRGNCLQIWHNCLQICLRSGIVGHSVPGFLQDWCMDRCILYVVPLVLENLLDGDHLAGVAELGLVHNPETPISDHLESKDKLKTKIPCFFQNKYIKNV